MALVGPATSPTVAVTRALKRAGLQQGKGKDFQVKGRYRNGERLFTYVRVYGTSAEAVVAERADDIERWTEESGFPFRVSVHYAGRWPVSDIHNGPRPRVRQEAPATAEAAPAAQESAVQAASAPAAVEPVTAVEESAGEEPTVQAAPEPAVSYREDYRQEEQAKALGWSTRHAEVVRWAAAGELRMDDPDDLRRVTIPGRAGRRVAVALLRPLTRAAFLTLGELDEDGRHRVEVTGDGRRALEVWDRKGPTPAVISRKHEGRELRPLLDGEEARRRAAKWEADLRRSAAEREAWYAAHDLRRAAEEQEERLRAVWVEVEGIRNPFVSRPAGWVPTAEQVEEYRIRPELVVELEEEAARLAAEAATETAGEQEGAVVPAAPTRAVQGAPEAPAAPAAGRAPELPAVYVRPASPYRTASALTLQSRCVSIEVSGGRGAHPERGSQRHEPHPHHRPAGPHHHRPGPRDASGRNARHRHRRVHRRLLRPPGRHPGRDPRPAHPRTAPPGLTTHRAAPPRGGPHLHRMKEPAAWPPSPPPPPSSGPPPGSWSASATPPTASRAATAPASSRPCTTWPTRRPARR
ncbi:hypothetical protein QEH48_gp112 [Streptomyces phage TurkishDelight]|uniref:Uncharacterized protein n=1 Tax=Streptomyces phage TurkishDelight TaxID=2793708 RepID=A0A7T0M180_9CAUD|nr:hypothetical protein QEH48_gp112 [Streptomyces phage TurkishDelight]QPL14141.1 hypothetical protein SEA_TURKISHDELIGHT_112 [Streptomyces phage TurkishDelight]